MERDYDSIFIYDDSIAVGAVVSLDFSKPLFTIKAGELRNSIGIVVSCGRVACKVEWDNHECSMLHYRHDLKIVTLFQDSDYEVV